MDTLLFFLKITTWIFTAFAILCLFAIAKFKFFKPKSNSSTGIEKRKPPKPTIKMLGRNGDVYEDEWHTYIAGVNHHASKYDIGGFCGYVANDSTNAHDPYAMGIYSSIKLLGYIPAKELKNYILWSGGEVMPCVGFVFVEDGQLRGRVKILKPCNQEFLEKEFSRYLQWVKDNYGERYLPEALSMSFMTE